MDGKAFCDSSKKQKHKDHDHDKVDIISTLHDSILGVILSFLPTKESVATAILSKRWTSLWTTVHNFNFFHYSVKDKNNDMKFVQFVNRCLLLHDDGLLNKFCLFWRYCCIPSYVTPWITTAITRNASELNLCLRYINRQFEIPTSVFKCASLRSLELECSPYISVHVCFLPKLESLKLVSVQFQSEQAFEILIRGCPVLNHLHLEDMLGFTFIISSTSLRRLELVRISDCTIKLEASSLEYFKLRAHKPKFFVLKSLSSLVEVDFGIYCTANNFSQADIYNSIVESVCAFDCTKALTLSADVMEALSGALKCGKTNLSIDFKRLVKLDTTICYGDYSSLLHLLQSSDNLEELMTCQRSRFLDKRELCDHLKWKTPAKVPRCLSNSLKKVVLNGQYVNDEDEREMIRYMLKHGSVLEVMQIASYGDMKVPKIEVVKEICEYPRKSSFCEVKFVRWTLNDKVEVCYTAWPLKKVSKTYPFDLSMK